MQNVQRIKVLLKVVSCIKETLWDFAGLRSYTFIDRKICVQSLRLWPKALVLNKIPHQTVSANRVQRLKLKVDPSNSPFQSIFPLPLSFSVDGGRNSLKILPTKVKVTVCSLFFYLTFLLEHKWKSTMIDNFSTTKHK